MKRFLISLFASLHASLFRYMSSAGMVLSVVDEETPVLVVKALDRIKTRIDEFKENAETRIGGVEQQVKGLEQLFAAGRPGGSYELSGEPGGNGQLGSFLEKSDALAALIGGQTRGVKMALPAGFMSKAAITSGAGISPTDYVPGIFGIARRRPTVRSLMRVFPTKAGSVSYIKQASRTIGAAPVSEGSKKPETPVDLDLLQAVVITLAHWTHASNQILADVPQLQFFIEQELRYGLEYVEDVQLLKGSGTGLNLNGLYTQATAAASVTGDMPSDLRQAIAQLAVSNYSANGIVIHPNDWSAIELLKAEDSGVYLVGQPRGANPAVLWNCQVIATTAMSQGTFLVGAFDQCGFIADRQEPTLDIATQDEDDFQRNLIKVRLEERLALAVTNTDALVKGTLA